MALIIIQNILTVRSVYISNKCEREQKVHYSECVPEPIFLDYLRYNIGECVGFKYFPEGVDIEEDRSLVAIACDGEFSYPVNKWGY